MQNDLLIALMKLTDFPKINNASKYNEILHSKLLWNTHNLKSFDLEENT